MSQLILLLHGHLQYQGVRGSAEHVVRDCYGGCIISHANYANRVCLDGPCTLCRSAKCSNPSTTNGRYAKPSSGASERHAGPYSKTDGITRSKRRTEDVRASAEDPTWAIP